MPLAACYIVPEMAIPIALVELKRTHSSPLSTALYFKVKINVIKAVYKAQVASLRRTVSK